MTIAPPEGSSAAESLLERVQQVFEDEEEEREKEKKGKGVHWSDEQTAAPPIAGWLLESPDHEQFDERLSQLSPARVLASLPPPPPGIPLTSLHVRGMCRCSAPVYNTADLIITTLSSVLRNRALQFLKFSCIVYLH